MKRNEAGFVLVKHLDHPEVEHCWLHIRTPRDIHSRTMEIRAFYGRAPEFGLWLARLRVVTQPLPPALEDVRKRWERAYSDLGAAGAADREAREHARHNGGRDALEAAERAAARREAAYQDYLAADRAWRAAVTSDIGLAFHAEVCGCAGYPRPTDESQRSPRDGRER